MWTHHIGRLKYIFPQFENQSKRQLLHKQVQHLNGNTFHTDLSAIELLHIANPPMEKFSNGWQDVYQATSSAINFELRNPL